jgi:hypothetical protein
MKARKRTDRTMPDVSDDPHSAFGRPDQNARSPHRRGPLIFLAIFSALAIAIISTILFHQLLSPTHVAPTAATRHARSSASDAASARDQAKLPLASPSAPTGLTAHASSPSRVTLSWRPDSRRAAVVRYIIYRDGRRIGASKAASFGDASVKAATTYSYKVSARNAAGKIGARSKAVSVTTPNALSPSSSPPASTPNGFPDAVNTGYENSAGYPGTLKDCNGVAIRSNTTYQNCDFPDGLAIGSASNHPTNVTFVGCRFASNLVNDATVADYGSGIVFSYDTFEPSTVQPGPGPTSPNAPPIANSEGYQYGIDQRYAGALTVDHSDLWGFEEAIQLSYSSSAEPVIISNSWIHNPRSPGSSDHTDGILENYGGLSYMTFNHNSVVGNGNTNALALQGAAGYSHVTITNNYFAGYGYMVNSGANTKSTDMIFTGNVWGTDIEPIFGPLYGNAMYTTPGLGGVWSDNTIYVQPGTTWMAADNNGLYWWPGDTNPSNSHQIIGHKTNYPGA